MRVLTYQSMEVLNILREQGTYKADLNLSREINDYKEDTAKLNGAVPVWGFVHPAWQLGFEIFADEFIYSTMFIKHRCEMSLTNTDGLKNFVLIEIDIPVEEIQLGTTHNSYNGSIIMDKLQLKDVVAVYSLVFPKGGYPRMFLPVVNVIDTLQPAKAMFTETVDTFEKQDMSMYYRRPFHTINDTLKKFEEAKASTNFKELADTLEYFILNENMHRTSLEQFAYNLRPDIIVPNVDDLTEICIAISKQYQQPIDLNCFNKDVMGDFSGLSSITLRDRWGDLVAIISLTHKTVGSITGLFITELYVVKKYRGYGIGDALLKEMLNALIVDEVYVEIAPKFKRTMDIISYCAKTKELMDFYKNFGFEEESLNNALAIRVLRYSKPHR